jgi:hypothetical protein
MKQVKKRSSSRPVWISSGIVLLFFLLVGGGLVYLLSTDKGGGKKVFIARVELVRPNLPDKPPPPPKEKPPEPEVKKETIVAPQDIEQQQARTTKGDDKPAPEGPLGLEGEGGAGSDAFGLAARGKGGRDVITLGSGPGGGSGGPDLAAIRRRHGRYNKLVENEIQEAVKRVLQENGGIPKGKLETQIQIGMDDGGAIAAYRIVRSSGNSAVDEAVKTSLKHARISEPPPEDIPRGAKGLTIMSIKITSQG